MREVKDSIPNSRFDSRPGHSDEEYSQRLATAAMFLGSCVALALSRGDGSYTRYKLSRNTATIFLKANDSDLLR